MPALHKDPSESADPGFYVHTHTRSCTENMSPRPALSVSATSIDFGSARQHNHRRGSTVPVQQFLIWEWQNSPTAIDQVWVSTRQESGSRNTCEGLSARTNSVVCTQYCTFLSAHYLLGFFCTENWAFSIV